jgi:enoyl-CoA hydratase/carnithine racemase
VLQLSGPVDGVATITLDRPDKRNALSIGLRDAVSDALDAMADDEAVRCVVVTGSGGVFSAGFDLGEFTSADPDVLWASSDRFHHAVLRFPVPTIAMVNGPALAGGFDLALLCDLRVAAPSARFAHPEQRFGDVVYSLLHDLVGGGVARDLCFTGRAVDAEEALRLGIVSRIAESCDDLAAEIAAAPREMLVRTKAKALARSGIDQTTRTLDL